MQARRKNKTFSELTTKTWNSEIGFSGYDSVEKTINGKKVSYDKRKAMVDLTDAYGNVIGQHEDREHKKLRKYRNSFRRQIADFFLQNFTGMRNDTSENDIGWIILKNWLWIPEKGAPTGLKVVQYIGVVLGLLTGITLAWGLYSLVRNITMNTAKVVLKFLPQLAVNGFSELQKRIKDELDHGNRGLIAQFGLQVADWALAVLKAPFQVIQFVGGAVLSPIDNARLAYKKAGILGAVASVAVTAALYAIFFPIVAAAVAKYVPAFFTGTVVPFVTAKMPWLVNAVNAVGNFLAPVTNFIGNAYIAVSGWVSQGLSWLFTNTIGASNILMTFTGMFNYGVTSLAGTMGLEVAPITIGLGAAFSTVGTVIGTPVSRLYNFVVNKLVDLKPGPVAPAAPVIAAPAPAVPALGSKAAIHAQLLQTQADLQVTQAHVGRLQGSLASVHGQLNPEGQPPLVAQVVRAADAAKAAHEKAEAAHERAVGTERMVTEQAAHKNQVAAVAKDVVELKHGHADIVARMGALPAPAAAAPAPAAVVVPAVDPDAAAAPVLKRSASGKF